MQHLIEFSVLKSRGRTEYEIIIIWNKKFIAPRHIWISISIRTVEFILIENIADVRLKLLYHFLEIKRAKTEFFYDHNLDHLIFISFGFYFSLNICYALFYSLYFQGKCFDNFMGSDHLWNEPSWFFCLIRYSSSLFLSLS